MKPLALFILLFSICLTHFGSINGHLLKKLGLLALMGLSHHHKHHHHHHDHDHDHHPLHLPVPLHIIEQPRLPPPPPPEIHESHHHHHRVIAVPVPVPPSLPPVHYHHEHHDHYDHDGRYHDHHDEEVSHTDTFVHHVIPLPPAPQPPVESVPLPPQRPPPDVESVPMQMQEDEREGQVKRGQHVRRSRVGPFPGGVLIRRPSRPFSRSFRPRAGTVGLNDHEALLAAESSGDDCPDGPFLAVDEEPEKIIYLA